MGRNRGKRNLRDGIAEKMSQKMHISNTVAISMFPYLEIMFQNDELAWEISDFLSLEKDEIKRFRKKVIPKAVIKKMEKQKEEMRIEERDRRAEELQNQMFAGIPTEEIVEEEPPRDEVELISEEPQVEEEPEEFTGIVLGVSTVAEQDPNPEPEEKPKGIASFIKQSYEKAKEAWQQLPEPVQIISVGILSLIGATGVVYGLAFLCGTARISCVTEDGKSRFLARLFIHKEDGCISLHLRKKVMQNAESRKIRIRLPRYYAKAHRYLPLMFSYAGRIYPMHVEQTMELSLDEFS